MHKIKERLERWCSAQGIIFNNPEAEESYKKRVKRITDAIQLHSPDRVPVTPAFGMFAALDNGFTCEDIFFDREKAFTAGMKTFTDFEPDTFRLPISAMSAPDTMDCRQAVPPGRGISPRSGIQFVEKECATADAFYDSLLYDLSDFTMRVFIPRILGTLEPFKKASCHREVFGYGRILPC